MGWYDVFSTFYDASSTHYYVEQHVAATNALAIEPGDVVLDLPCGTGQAFDTLVPKLGANGLLVGVDLSSGMLGKAQARVTKNGWTNVRLERAAVEDVSAELVTKLAGKPTVDKVHVFLGMSCFPDYPAAFQKLWSVLRPGGRFVIVDIHAERASVGTWITRMMTHGDVLRRWWEPLEAVAEGYSRTPLPSLPAHGGQIFLVTGTKPR